jgi:hypothetical protein
LTFYVDFSGLTIDFFATQVFLTQFVILIPFLLSIFAYFVSKWLKMRSLLLLHLHTLDPPSHSPQINWKTSSLKLSSGLVMHPLPLLFLSCLVSSPLWFLNSACCNHMTPYPSFFSHTSSTRHAPTIHTANGSTILVHSIGTVSTSKLSISDVFHVSQLSYNLLFVD